MDDLSNRELARAYVDVLEEFTYELPPEDFISIARNVLPQLQELLTEESLDA